MALTQTNSDRGIGINKSIVCIGTSMTQGAGSSFGLNYSNQLMLLGNGSGVRATVNQGIGGQNSMQIGARIGAVPLYISIRKTMTGTIVSSTANKTITGTGTLFTTETVVGANIYDNTGSLIGTIATITNNTSITLVDNSLISVSAITPQTNTTFTSGSTSSVSVSALKSITKNLTLTGYITSSTSSASITGTSSKFLTEIRVGDILYGNVGSGFFQIGTVLSIASDTSLTLTANALSTNTGYQAYTTNSASFLASNLFLSTAATNATTYISGVVSTLNAGVIRNEGVLITRTATGTAPTQVETYTLNVLGYPSSIGFVPDGSIFCPNNQQNYNDYINVLELSQNDALIAPYSDLFERFNQAINNLAKPKRFIVLGAFTIVNSSIGTTAYNQTLAYNTALAALFPNQYVDTLTPPTDVEMLQCNYTPTAQDLTDISNGVIPRGMHNLSSPSDVHLNNYGYNLIAIRIKAVLDSFNW
jgi:lysophospholipase L1-like esterase